MKDISFSKKKIIFDEIKKTGIKIVTISGGEPLCNKDLLPVLRYAKKNGFKIILHTNGLLIDEKMIRNLKQLVLRVSLSFDGSCEEITEKNEK